MQAAAETHVKCKIMKNKIELIMAFWIAGYFSSQEVIEWADKQIQAIPEPSDELIELSLYGPEVCYKKPVYEFPNPKRLNYLEKFSLNVIKLDLLNNQAIENFIVWASRSCIGENLYLKEVILGYQLDHLLNDCFDMKSAKECLSQEIIELIPICKKRIDNLLSGI